MNKIFKNFFPLMILILLCSCSKGVKIEESNLSRIFDNSMFRGVVPDIPINELYDIVGTPNEYLDIEGDSDTEEHSPIYYFDDGKLICHWSGNEREIIGMVDFTPFENKPMYLQDILNVPFEKYDINEDTKRVRLYQGDKLYYIIELDNFKVKEIEYWLLKPGLFTIS